MNNEKISTKKKVLYVVLATCSVIMAGFIVYDMFFQSKPVKRPVSVASGQIHAIDQPKYVELQNSGAPVDLVPAPQKSSLEPAVTPRFQLSVSDKTQQLLDALENDVVSKAIKAANDAKLAEIASQKALIEVQAPPKQENPVSRSVESSPAELISVKSIVFNPTRTTAWLQVGQELIPVEQDAFVNDLRVLSIHKNFVRLIDKHGKVFSKYINTKPERLQGEQNGIQ